MLFVGSTNQKLQPGTLNLCSFRLTVFVEVCRPHSVSGASCAAGQSPPRADCRRHARRRLRHRTARRAHRLQPQVRRASYMSWFGASVTDTEVQSIRGEINMRVLEALSAGALLLLEADNREAPLYLRPYEHYVPYTAADLEAVIDHYLTHEDERACVLLYNSGFVCQLTVSTQSHCRRWPRG